MTAREVVTLTEENDTLDVPQSGDTYKMPRSVSITGTLAASGAVTGSNLNVSNWDTAYGWGDHSAAGYLASSAIDTLAELNAIISDATLIDTTDSRLSDARTPTAHNQAWSTITSTPTTISGYGITDAVSSGGALGTPSSGTLTNCTGYPAPEGTTILSTGETGGTKVLTENGAGGAAWVEPAAGGGAGWDVEDTTNGNYGHGLNALDSITVGSGIDNIAIGENAGTAITTGDKNICIGTDAGKGTTGAFGNVAIGYQALPGTNAGGDRNIAIGETALEDLSSGNNNVSIGYDAGRSISSGAGNVCIGGQSCGSSVTSGDYNIMLGLASGPSTGDRNICILASGGGPSVLTDSYQIAIGANNNIALKPIISGYMGGDSSDWSGKSIEFTGPSAQLNLTSGNVSGGDAIVSGGFASTTSSGVGGDLYLRGGTGGNTGSDGLVLMDNLPTSDPTVAGALWNDSGTLKISAG